MHITWVHPYTNQRLEFEVVWIALMDCETSPNLDSCVQKVLHEELRLQSLEYIS